MAAGFRSLFAFWAGGAGNLGSPAAVVPPTQGMGPGWNLFHPTSTRKRKADTLEDEIREAIRRAENAESPREQRLAIKEIKAVVAEAAREAPRDVDEYPLLQFLSSMEALRSLDLGAVAYVEATRRALAMKAAQEDDDRLALEVITRLA